MADSDHASLTEGERAFLLALQDLGVAYLLVGMSAALIQGARGATEDLDLWAFKCACCARIIVSKRAANRMKDQARWS